eukprot:TRINITY_DN22906_c0_g1_i1.p1 TRINITY_DN22906_c0_g1~~TRINITY_DN22906_c0_g1_i1.p1  ORF type:complete len:526 (+),score=123.79 TRINITY_DN22906_c0_g1_i1:122-1699(+)
MRAARLSLRGPDFPLDSSPNLAPAMGLPGAVAVTVGIMIGAGIFATPGFVVDYVKSPGAALLVWTICGLMSLAGALCYAELGAALPDSGGEAVYLRRAYGNGPAFLYVWTVATIAKPAGESLIAMVMADYLCRLGYDDLDDAPWALRRCTAAAVVVLLSFGQVLSTKAAMGAQSSLAAIKMVLVVLLIAFGVYEAARGGEFVSNLDPSNSLDNTEDSIGDWSLALANCLWAYNGWNNINLCAGEVRSAERNIPRAAMIALPLVIAAYLWINVSYCLALPIGTREGEPPVDLATVAGAETLAVDFAKRVAGSAAGVVVTVGVALSALGSCNGNIFAGARLVHASSVSGVLPIPVLTGELNLCGAPTPAAAYAIQAVFAVTLILAVGDFEVIVEMLMWTLWVWYGLTVACLLWLRKREPLLFRPYRVPLALPVAFIAAALFVVVVLFASSPASCGAAAGVIAIGIPVDMALRRWCDTRGEARRLQTLEGESLRLLRRVDGDSQPPADGAAIELPDPEVRAADEKITG